MKKLSLIGCQSGVAGRDVLCGEGPKVIQASPFLADLIHQGLPVKWDAMVVPDNTYPTKTEAVAALCTDLAKVVSLVVKQHQRFCVIAGDHSSAIGTWSGVYDAMHQQGDLGLIWIDAHMDAHTPETSPSHNIHGMPLACLLGHGYPALISILQNSPKLKPENICLVGVRSFEKGESDLLKRLGVKIFFMDDVARRGINVVMKEAVQHVKQRTVAFGVTLDMDAIDPMEAPGVDVPEANGIHFYEMLKVFEHVFADPALIGCEIVEFDPHLDVRQQTEKLVISLIELAAAKYAILKENH
jgi:arginase